MIFEGGNIMDYTAKTRSLQSLVKDMNKGTINLSHKLQRPEGQWNRKRIVTRLGYGYCFETA